MLLSPETDEHVQFLMEFMRDRGVDLPYSTDLRHICRAEGGRIIGVVAFNGFNGRTCSIHSAGDGNWISREFLRAAFTYPFETCNIIQIFGMVSDDNERAIKLNRHLGFEVMQRIRHGWDEQHDLVVMGMHRSQCRWLQDIRSRREKQAA